MLKIEVNKEYTEVNVEGSLVEITSDVTRTLANLHATLYSNDPKCAEAFKQLIQKAVMDEDGPVWSLIFLPDVEGREPTIKECAKQMYLFLKSLERKMK